jgi:hypothetical protein
VFRIIHLLLGSAIPIVLLLWRPMSRWACGSNDVEVNGQTVPGDERRATGIAPDLVMAVDPTFTDVCLTGPIGASASFYDTLVRLVPIA